ncbi:MAG: hypothetical protein PSU94_10810 [Lacunisphaera sp.]|nr:hypothetical protein [Lacunisphaera sp.]
MFGRGHDNKPIRATVSATFLFGSGFYALFAFARPAPWHFLHSLALTV